MTPSAAALLEARTDRRRGDLRQHRHRAGDGVRGARLSVRRDDGRDVLDRAPQDHARARREGDPDAGGRARQRHGARAPKRSRRSTAGSSRGSSRTRPTPRITASTTGPEILRDFAGRRLDYWVTGWGTGGTLTGAGEMLKLARPEVKIVATEPAGAALLAGKEWKPHKIQGWTPDFLPAVLEPRRSSTSSCP